eukprot:6776154-Pyramimonas_sp.AAC.1
MRQEARRMGDGGGGRGGHDGGGSASSLIIPPHHPHHRAVGYCRKTRGKPVSRNWFPSCFAVGGGDGDDGGCGGGGGGCDDEFWFCGVLARLLGIRRHDLQHLHGFLDGRLGRPLHHLGAAHLRRLLGRVRWLGGRRGQLGRARHVRRRGSSDSLCP